MNVARLDRVTALMLRLLPATDAPPNLAKLRGAQHIAMRAFPYRGRGRAGGSVDLRIAPGLRARLYRPVTRAAVPTVVFFHGGGWVTGDIDGYGAQCRRLRDDTGSAVLSVSYRLAPEQPFPAAVQDAIVATQWAARNAYRLGGDPAAVGVAGDSAGGNLAAVAAIAMRDAGTVLRAQLLLYPAIDFVGLRSGVASTRYPSHARNGATFGLALARMQWYADAYVPGEDDRTSWRASPIRAATLRGVAPAVIATAEFDPLLDEGRAYATALREAHVPVRYLENSALIHGFYALASLSPGARRAARAAGQAFGAALRMQRSPEGMEGT